MLDWIVECENGYCKSARLADSDRLFDEEYGKGDENCGGGGR